MTREEEQYTISTVYGRNRENIQEYSTVESCVCACMCMSLSVCKCGWGWGNGGGVISNYRVCTTKSPERRREEKRRRREKALPLSAALSTVASGDKKKGERFQFTWCCAIYPGENQVLFMNQRKTKSYVVSIAISNAFGQIILQKNDVLIM